MNLSLCALSLGLVLAASSTAHAGDPPTVARIACADKYYPNVAGQTAVTLNRQADGSYSATYESYGPVKTKKGLRCHFDANPLVFACANKDAAWGLSSMKLDERSIDLDGKAADAHVYKIEAVRAPLGEPRVELEMRLPLAACKVGG